MRRLASAWIIAATAAGAAACRSPMTAGADYDTAAPFGHPATFAWNGADAFPTGDPRLDNNPFFVARLHGAIERELGSRGVRFRGAAPALLVHHHAAVRSRTEIYEVDRDAGYTWSNRGPEPQFYQYDEGTFLVDIADARTKEIVWRGWARADLAGALDDPEALSELIDDAVSEMFEHFPIPVGSVPPAEPEPPASEPAPPAGEVPPDFPDWP